jgi:CheY-like chemotaxis protein
VEKVCLIVDDEPVIREFLKAILREEGYKTVEAENAPQAFKMVQQLDGLVNLVLSDITMPGDMDGLDLAYSLREAFPAIPVVLISGFTLLEPIPHFDFVPKPFQSKKLLEAITRATSRIVSKPARALT